MKKKVFAGIVTATLALTTLVGCGANNNTSTGGETSENSQSGSYKIAISQFAQHGSLDNCREGFLEGLKEEGFIEGENLTVDYQNSNADTGTANQIAQNFVGAGVDLICSIATPSAQSAYNAAMNSNIPVIYTAVTDPVAAELAKEDKTPVGNTTGTSDKLAVDEQLQMIRDILPDARKIGILYTTSEVNSESTVKEYEELANNYGFKIIAKGVSTTADIPLATDDLLGQVDCLNNLTDNTVVSALPTILAKANEKNIPVFGSEIEQVKIGCLAAQGIDYVALGKQTGKMAAKVLKGEKKASEIPFEVIEESSLYLNTKVAENLGVTLPEQTIQAAAEKFDIIAEE